MGVLAATGAAGACLYRKKGHTENYNLTKYSSPICPRLVDVIFELQSMARHKLQYKMTSSRRGQIGGGIFRSVIILCMPFLRYKHAPVAPAAASTTMDVSHTNHPGRRVKQGRRDKGQHGRGTSRERAQEQGLRWPQCAHQIR